MVSCTHVTVRRAKSDECGSDEECPEGEVCIRGDCIPEGGDDAGKRMAAVVGIGAAAYMAHRQGVL